MIIFNTEQDNIINEAIFWYHYKSDLVYQFAGVAGTGKSLVLSEIIKRLNIPIHRVATMAYTGAATIVLRQRGIFNAKTIHSWLYKPVEDYIYNQDGSIERDDYLNRPKTRLKFEPKELVDIDLIIIDEASMVPYSMKKEIESRNIKIIATGDLGQLPPVADKPAYLYEGNISVLTQIMRQALNSGIIYLSDRARKGLTIHKGLYNDVLVIDEDELTDMMVYHSDVILTGTNNTRDFINKKIRKEFLHTDSEIPKYMERMICRKNNWDLELDGINMANGLRGVVVNEPGVHKFTGNTYTIDFQPSGFNNAFTNLECDYKYLIAPTNMKKELKNNRYRKGEKMEFAYSLTTHLSQGSQYNNIIYIEEYLNKDIQNNLNYTGITRATNSLIYIKKKRVYY